MEAKKYKLLPSKHVHVRGLRNLNTNGLNTIAVRQIQALIDIPMHNVLRGDKGGYIINLGSKKKLLSTLSQEGSCWIGQKAIVGGNVSIEDDALIDGMAVVMGQNFDYPFDASHRASIWGRTRITGMAKVHIGGNNIITGNSVIDGYASLSLLHENSALKEFHNLTVSDQAIVEDPAFSMDNCHFSNNVQIIGISSHLKDIVFVSGAYSMLDQAGAEETVKAMYRPKKEIDIDNDFNLDDIFGVAEYSLGDSAILNVFDDDDDDLFNMASTTEESYVEPTISILVAPVLIPSKAMSQYKYRVQSVEDEFNAYRHDIVKLIKYPLMADLSDSLVLRLVYTLKRAKNLLEDDMTTIEQLSACVQELEESFLMAESKARTVVNTQFDTIDKAKLKTAEKLLMVACNDASSDNEKKLSCERALKGLQGILPLEDKLIDNLWVTVGLKEIEA